MSAKSSYVSEIKLGRLAALFLVLALGGCAQMATEPGQEPYAPYSHGNGPDMRSGNNGM